MENTEKLLVLTSQSYELVSSRNSPLSTDFLSLREPIAIRKIPSRFYHDALESL